VLKHRLPEARLRGLVNAAPVIAEADSQLVAATVGVIFQQRPARAGRTLLKNNPNSRGNQLRICFSDNGRGIDKAAQARLGEPVFKN
ncbi:ATP-binding protein, partial [Pseudomonas syringae pv. tagetis]